MADRLVESITALNQSAALRQRFQNDRKGILDEYGVSAADQKIILNEDMGALMSRLKDTGVNILVTFHSPL